jgi:type 1 glutamine amidotransferase
MAIWCGLGIFVFENLISPWSIVYSTHIYGLSTIDFHFMIRLIFSTITALLLITSCTQQQDRILVFSKTTGFRHSSIEAGKQAIIKLGKENNFAVDTTEDAGLFYTSSLKKYKAVIFLNTTGDVLNAYQKKDFEKFIQAGGGFIGIHSATDTEYNWHWYGKMVGAYFMDHPQTQEAKLYRASRHELNEMLPEEWIRTDEWYNFKDINRDINVLLYIDESSYEGGKHGEYHPISWWHNYDGGRAFYTAMGHTEESYKEDLFLQHILAGIEYAMGRKSFEMPLVMR